MTKQGGQTGPTFHQTLVFKMLGEMFDLFDGGFTERAGKTHTKAILKTKFRQFASFLS